MEILYVSKLCSKKKFEEFFLSSTVKPQQQAQKYHYLFTTGLAMHEDMQVTALSALPITRTNSKRIWWTGSSETEQRTEFKYIPHLNLVGIGHLAIFIATFLVSYKWCITNKMKERYIVCDVLNLTVSLAAKAAAKLSWVKNIAIITDVPSFMRDYSKPKRKVFKSLIISLYTLFSEFSLQRYDAYIVLTKQMNELINPKNKLSIVIEGMVDTDMLEEVNLIENKYQEKVVVYAGALYEKFGIRKLIEAFLNVSVVDAVLWIYGSGELEEEIRQYGEKDSRIKFWGAVLNKEILEIEIKATLLINPRPSSEEFTKYSFPSKNMEYMASGTALLTTKLPGMPEEYYDYVYLFEDESVVGMAKTMECILKLPKEELHAKGIAAKEFVLREKNNVVQSAKILEMIRSGATLKHERKC
jgi:glycosyltransferase involved in cell wall biosynthesis